MNPFADGSNPSLMPFMYFEEVDNGERVKMCLTPGITRPSKEYVCKVSMNRIVRDT